jgi:hypothetical protein
VGKRTATSAQKASTRKPPANKAGAKRKSSR